jgi:cbb3-type cytochrome oxidase subunit 3
MLFPNKLLTLLYCIVLYCIVLHVYEGEHAYIWTVMYRPENKLDCKSSGTSHLAFDAGLDLQ